MRLYLARHAPHDLIGDVLTGRSGGAGLSAGGRGQARRLARALRGAPIHAVHCSPQRRTRETAGIIADQLKLEVQIVDALDEIDFGDWTGKRFADLAREPDWIAWNERRSCTAPPGGERMQAVVERARSHIEARMDEVAGLLCVSHCDVIRGLIAHYLGLDLDHMLRFDIEPASFSMVDIGNWGGRVVTLNRVPA